MFEPSRSLPFSSGHLLLNAPIYPYSTFKMDLKTPFLQVLTDEFTCVWSLLSHQSHRSLQYKNPNYIMCLIFSFFFSFCLICVFMCWDHRRDGICVVLKLHVFFLMSIEAPSDWILWTHQAMATFHLGIWLKGIKKWHATLIFIFWLSILHG